MMEPGKCALVITSSVYVNAPYTVLSDPGQRASQYMDSIMFFIQDSPLTKIIVCDNSGYHYPESLYELASSCDKQLELLSFTGNKELVGLYGKGYGEGEIMEYIFSNSILIRRVEGFLKITGRLKLVNIGELLQQSDHGVNYFMPVSLLRPRWLVPKAARPCVDIRVYYAGTAFFRDNLLAVYKQVRERDVYFLEHAYHDALARSGARVKCFPVAPEFSGVSGSNGWEFRERSWWKKKLIKLVSWSGFIRPVYRVK